MSSKIERTALPPLRFPEFQNAEEWIENQLRGICQINPSHHGLPNRFYYIDLGAVSDGKLFDVKEISKTTAPSRAQRLLQNEDVIYQIVRPYQMNNLYCKFDEDKKFVASTGYAQLRALNSSAFLYQLVHSALFVENVISKCTGSNYPAINSSDLARIPVFVPEPKEQQKVADCLTSLKNLITVEGKKLTALEEHKKGLMQKLFPKKDETIPHLRFPEFLNTEDWEETTIGNIGKFYYGKSAPKWSLEENAPTPCVRYGELYTKFRAVINETYSRTNIDPKNLRFSKGGEVLVPRVGERPEEFGKCCSYLPLANVAIGEMISVFETDQNPLFYTYYFRRLYAEFAKVVEGQNVKNLYYAELEPLRICRPSPPEQKKISDFLSSIEEQIITQRQKVENLKDHKKGLMQQLFPSPDELEG